MDPIDKFLKQYSYKFPKGYPDMKNEQDILLMESLLNNLGISLKEDKITTPQVIRTILSSDEAKGKLGPHSRPKRIKNIGNITNNEFIDIISNIFDIDPKDIKILPPKSPNNPSSRNFAFQFPIEEKDIILVLGMEVIGANIEDYELSNLNKAIEEKGGSINIKVGEKIYKNITTVDKIPGNKQADFIFKGTENLYIQHKDIQSQQLSGMSKLSDNDEVKSFVEAVKQISGGELKNKDSYKRDIKSDDLKLKAAYGSGEDFGIDKVEIICFGNITLVDEGEYFIITSPTYFVYPKQLTGEYTPHMAVTFRNNMSQQDIKNARFGFYPKKVFSTAKAI
jgi:hypothetical protein